MSKNLVVSGETSTGKTMVALAIAEKLREDNRSVGYFKPIGKKDFQHSTDEEDVDVDAAVMKEVLGLESKLGCICPIIRTQASYDEFIRIGHDQLMKKIMDCYNDVSQEKEYLIIEGTKAPWHLLHVGLSTPQIAYKLEASVVCLVNFADITAIDDVLLQRDFFQKYGVEEIGIILNMVPPMFKATIKDEIAPFLEENGVRFCGTVYRNRELFSPSIRDIQSALGGQMVTGEDKMELLIDQFMVGSMAPENALKWFRRAKDKAVITSGDRSDICLAAMETDTHLLILTGGLGPDIRTIARAKELGIPIMMTAHDTYTTGQIADSLLGTITPDNTEKILAVQKIIGEAIDLTCLGL